eukprot:15433960-Alexandrium_andersonii.AAC.1
MWDELPQAEADSLTHGLRQSPCAGECSARPNQKRPATTWRRPSKCLSLKRIRTPKHSQTGAITLRQSWAIKHRCLCNRPLLECRSL